jgi:glycosyltransferase involved in cell wall biosynthesis
MKPVTIYINGRFLSQQITGVQQFAFEICRYLQYADLDLVLLLPKDVEVPHSLSHLRSITVGKSSGYRWEQIELPFFLKKQGSPLLINFCNTAPLLYRNQWITIHDLAFMHHPEWFSKSFAQVYRFLIPKIARRSLKVFTVSKTIRKQLMEVFDLPENRIEILYNGISHDLLNAVSTGNPRKKMILTVSSINPRKNLATLIDAFHQSSLHDYELVIVGAKNTVYAAENTEHHPGGRIRFAGYVNNQELAQLYQEAALFVSLSYDEGFGIPVLEALHSGCQVLLSEIEVYKECFGDVALFTSATDATKAAADMEYALAHPPVAQGIHQLMALYNYEESAKKLSKLLREAVEKM